MSASAFEQLREIVARLRAPDGCPWDREQTHESLRGGLIEEAYEVLEAIERQDDKHLREELGDLLLQVVMHSQIAAEEKRFTMDDVARDVAEKLVRRHPHVFGEKKLADSVAVLKQWDQLKREEKAADSHLDHISSALPELMRAEKVQKRAARAGFDWRETQDVIAKIREETDEIELALDRKNRDAVQDELGDLLFAVVNLIRKAGFDAELTLRQATNKFIRRFQEMEKRLHAQGRRVEECDMDELDALWDAVKAG